MLVKNAATGPQLAGVKLRACVRLDDCLVGKCTRNLTVRSALQMTTLQDETGYGKVILIILLSFGIYLPSLRMMKAFSRVANILLSSFSFATSVYART